MNWLRLYTDILDDEKVVKMSDTQYRIFTYLMLLAKEKDQNGSFAYSPVDIAWRLRRPKNQIENTIEKLIELEIITIQNNNLVFINWSKRQYKSDNVNDRVKRYRQKNETLHETDQIRLDTDTEQIQKEIKAPRGESLSLEFEKFYSEYPKHVGKKPSYQAWKKSPNKPTIDVILEALRAQKRNKAELQSLGQFCPEWPDPERWIKKERWNDELIKIEVIQNAGTTTNFRDKRSPGLSPEQEREADAINAEYYRRKALETADNVTGNAQPGHDADIQDDGLRAAH